jgi:hypothetical protein
MKTDCLHFDFKTIDYWITKHNWYSSKETVDYFDNLNRKQDRSELNFVTWIKMSIYYKLPLGIRSHLYYLYIYYIRLAFLDGKEGEIYAFLRAYWYRYLIDIKIYECRKMGIRYLGKGELKY